MSIDQRTFFEQQMLREENCVSMYTRFAGIVNDPGLRDMFHEFARQAQAHRDTSGLSCQARGSPKTAFCRIGQRRNPLRLGDQGRMPTSQAPLLPVATTRT